MERAIAKARKEGMPTEELDAQLKGMGDGMRLSGRSG